MIGGGSTRERSGEPTAKDPMFAELNQRMKTLQLPAACSFVFGIIERCVTTCFSHRAYNYMYVLVDSPAYTIHICTCI